MSKLKVLWTDNVFNDISREKARLEAAGFELVVGHHTTPDEVIAAAHDADALIVVFAPINAQVLESLTNCKIIVRCGIGFDNVDLEAAKARNIPVCNVPDYCIDEVADHAFALALALGRQLPQIDKRLRGGVWKVTPDRPMLAFRETNFAVAGFGRIGRAVLDRARALGFRLGAYDPFVNAEQMAQSGVTKLSLDELFTWSDVLSLHLPLSSETQHIVNSSRLKSMKSNAVLVNTSRGGLIDTYALAEALKEGTIASAGLDVFESEPLVDDHPLRQAENALLTSHVAWYSESSVPALQSKVLDEILRGLNGEPLKNQVNK